MIYFKIFWLLLVVFFTHYRFSHQRKLMVFHWRLRDSKSPQVSRTLLSILAVFNNAVVWMVFTRPPTSKSSRPFNNPFVSVRKSQLVQLSPSCSIVFSILQQSRGTYLFFPILSGLFCGQPGQQSRQFCKFSFFLLIIMRSSLLAEIRLSICMSKFHRSLCVSFSRTGAGLCIYHLLVWSNFNFLHICQWINLPIIIILLLLLFTPKEFFTSADADGFNWSLSEKKSPQVSRTPLSILTVFNNSVVWMVSTRLPTSKSSSPFNNPLGTVPIVPITVDTIDTFMFHSFFNSLARSRYLSFFSYSFSFILYSQQFCKFSLFLLLVFLFTLRQFFTSVLADGFSLKFEWQKSLLNSPGLFSVFWPFSIMLSFGWSPLVLHLPSPPVPLIILLLQYQKLQSLLI